MENAYFVEKKKKCVKVSPATFLSSVLNNGRDRNTEAPSPGLLLSYPEVKPIASPPYVYKISN